MKVNDLVKVKVLKYWLQGIITELEGDHATVQVPVYYGSVSSITVEDKVENLIAIPKPKK